MIELDWSQKTPAEISDAAPTLAATLVAMSALNAETMFSRKSNLVSRTDPDHKPSDVMAVDDAIEALGRHAATIARLGLHHIGTDLNTAASLLDEQEDRIEQAQANVNRLLAEIAQHTQTILVLDEEVRSLRYAATGVSTSEDVARARAWRDEVEADDHDPMPGSESLDASED